MSARDFARLGLFLASDGIWAGEQVVTKILPNPIGPAEEMNGVHLNFSRGWGIVNGKEGYFSWGQCATKTKLPSLKQIASWIAGPVQGTNCGTE
jgi:hypothetical protein